MGAAILLLGIAGCVSTQDRYEKAQRLTMEQRYAEAARYYVQVLEAEPDWSGARNELQAVGQRAIDQFWEEAEQAATRGQYEEAVAALDALDALRTHVEAVAVPLTVPDHYAAFRRATVRAAADTLIATGRQAETAADWPAAFDAYEQARPYVQADSQRATLDRAQARATLRWAEVEMERGRHRAAYDRATLVPEFVGAEHPLARDAETVQRTAVARGTRTVAFLPLWRTRGPTGSMPAHFREALNAVLQYDYWRNPPRFVASADPIETRRALQRAGHHRAVLRAEDAMEVGRAVGADMVVAGELTAFERTEEDLEESVRPVRMRVRGATGQGSAWRDTTYTVQTFDDVLEATVAYRIVDARTGRVLERGEERVRHAGERQRGLFAGDASSLELSDDERRLFDREGQQATAREIENELIDRLAERLAEVVFDRVLRHID